MPKATHVFPSWPLRIKGTEYLQNNYVALKGEVSSGGDNAFHTAWQTVIDGSTKAKKDEEITQLTATSRAKVAKVTTLLLAPTPPPPD